jgi:recombinational DNA repair protein (RecF pathway)
MDDVDLRLDGNAAAGLLEMVLDTDLTAALRTCAGCGTSAPLGANHLYVHAPGLVLRCPTCESVGLRVVRARERVLLDLAGTARLEFVLPSAPDSAPRIAP